MSKTYFNDASFVLAGAFGVVVGGFVSSFSPQKPDFLRWGEHSILSFFTAAGFCSL